MVDIKDRRIFCSWVLDMTFCSVFSENLIGTAQVLEHWGLLEWWTRLVVDQAHGEAVTSILRGF